MSQATCNWDNTTASRKRTRTKRYNEESWQAGRHTPNTGISSKATLPSAWRDKCTTTVCCQLWHMVQRPGHWPNKRRTNLRPHRPKWKEVCSTWSNIWVRERTKLIDIIYNVRKMKWSWAGHINRLKDDRWTSCVTTWRPYNKKRRQGRPAKRWRDDLDKYWSDTIWQRTAQDRVIWRRHAEAFAQPRTGHN